MILNDQVIYTFIDLLLFIEMVEKEREGQLKGE